VATVVFVGRVTAKDARTARFRIDQVRAGSPAGYAVGPLVDVRYDKDVQYLHVGEQYLVGAVPQGTKLVMTSKVREDEPLFGGNAVVGLTDTATDCPVVEDPVRTFHVDGSEIHTSVLEGLKRDKQGIVLALAKPVIGVIGVVLLLVLIRWLIAAYVMTVRAASEAGRGPTKDLTSNPGP
jgi:hypothetical protein